jgi:hypothetical protein
MSTTPVSSNLGRDDSRRGNQKFPRSLALRMRVAVQCDVLTRELAAGSPPGLSPELERRAAQLVSPRGRRQVARTWRATLKEVHEPPMTRAYYSLIRRGAVIAAEDAIDALIMRLNSTRPVAAQGMAMLYRVMTDGLESPLYAPAEREALRRRIIAATEALDPARPELPLTA